MIILKIRKPFIYTLRFKPYAPFVYRATVSFNGYTQPSRYDASFDFTNPALNQTEIDITDVYVDNEKYDEEASEALCISNEKSFYFDLGAQYLYIHIDHTKRFPSSDFDSLKVQGYCSDTVFYDSNNIEFLPYLRSSISITQSADRLVYNKMGFVQNNADLDNSDGEFDQFFDNPTPGADANFSFISQKDLENGVRVPTSIYTGFSIGDNPTKENYRIVVQDKRSQLSLKIPQTRFNVTDYPNIKYTELGKIIPEGYGDIIGAPAFCTNGNITSGNVEYKFATDATSISTIYVKTDDAWNIVTPVSTDAANGEFVLSAADARDAQGNFKPVKVNARFRNIDLPGNIIIDMLSRYYGISYTTQYFNTTEWASETANLQEIYLYMGKYQDFFMYVEEIQNASNYGFMFDVDADGKFTIRIDDLYRDISATYQSICNISPDTPAERDFQDFATSIRVTYDEDQESGDNSAYTSTLYETLAFDVYRLYKELTFPSNLTNATDAQDKADRIALDYSVARLQFSIELDTIVNHRLYDIIQIDTREYIDGVVVREYAGDRILKLSTIQHDFNNEKTTLIGYDITDIRG